MAEDADAFPALGNDIFLTIASKLALPDLASALRVSASWRAVLDGTDQLWWGQCQSAWRYKAYVPKASVQLAPAGQLMGMGMAAGALLAMRQPTMPSIAARPFFSSERR